MTLKASLPTYRNLFSRSVLPFLIELKHLVLSSTHLSSLQEPLTRVKEKMAGSNGGGYLKYVLKMDDGGFNCAFCGHPFSKGTSTSRIKWHLSGDEGHGVSICGQVPEDVQEELRGGNNRHKTIASSSNGQRRKTIEVAPLKSGWTLLMTSLILEIASAVFDQLGNALVGMVFALVALLLSAAELLIHMARKERMRPSDSIVDYFGLVGAVWQCVYSTVEYAYARKKRDNPIKMCLLPFIFLLCVVISKLRDKAAEFGDLRNKYGDFQVTFSNENQERIIGKYSSLESFVKNLEVIEVSDCEKMVEIIERKSDDEGLIDEESSRSSRNTDIELPKLIKLKLIELLELKCICSTKQICDSLEVIQNRFPFLESNQSSPHPSLEIITHPEERWRRKTSHLFQKRLKKSYSE